VDDLSRAERIGAALAALVILAVMVLALLTTG
jgi:hypothetical protein